MVAPAAAHAPPTLVQRRPASALLPYVSAYTGYRMDAGPPSTHQGVPGAHLTFLLCLDGAVELLRLPDPARSPATFVAMVGGLHDRPAVIAQGARRPACSCGSPGAGPARCWDFPPGSSPPTSST
ncbi:MAG: hypothetical protein ACRDRH_14370 [Pseudonocardia sp.]